MTEPPIVQVEAARTFTRDLRTLAKKYRSIYQDVQPIIEELQNGNIVGDQIPNIGYAVFKVRIRNTDIQKGRRLLNFTDRACAFSSELFRAR
ncbi:type II toxin-antitoxin system RelE/ParE family toxin [Myxacorys almedinensis]|uniref:Type II toxin-antitoxin system RelE/ParE family toxin n=1 Tax=Myxacorys almedinensis A TaxID=2690445 RepID=A0A8J7YYD9_9CYAN|nr:type II toxin-antitoxin system RelE/ParE family toxin [Myxacorys almedinensis]NDJ16902.1 type II toxin-antitoxin system RelE/ParE family toxin [Myxacorys almedinensis A]